MEEEDMAQVTDGGVDYKGFWEGVRSHPNPLRMASAGQGDHVERGGGGTRHEINGHYHT